MIEIKINNQSIDLPRNFSFNFVWNNPAFNIDAIMGDISYPISFPLTNRNKKFFDFPHLQSVSATKPTFNLIGYDNNIEVVNGVFFVTSITGDYVKGNIKSSISALFSDLDSYMKDVDFGGDLDPTSSTSANSITIFNQAALYDNPNPLNYNYSSPLEYFPVKNLDFFKDCETGIKTYHIDFSQYFMNYFNPLSAVGSGSYWTGKGFRDHAPNYINTINPHLTYVLFRLFSNLGYSSEGSFITNPDIIKIILLSLNAQPYGKDIAKSFSGQKVVDFLTMLKNKFNVGFFADNINKTVSIDFNKDIFDYSEIEDWSKKVSPKISITPASESGFHLSDSIDNNDSYANKYNVKSTNFDLLSTVSTFSNLPAPVVENSVCFVTNEAKYYIYLKNQTTGLFSWVFFSYPETSVLAGNGDKKIESGAQILKNEDFDLYPVDYSAHTTNTYSMNFNVPIIQQVGNNSKILDSSENPFIENTFGFKPLFWQGLVKNSDNHYYPRASAERLDPNGNQKTAFSLFTNGDDGTYKNFWETFLSRLGNPDIVKRYVLLKPIDIFQLDFKKPKMIDNQLYFVKSIKTKFPIQGPSEVELIKVSSTPHSSIPIL